MKSFWISLLVFILFMCSCKTKKIGSEVDFTTKENVQIEQTKFQALVDTTSVLNILTDNSKLKIIETITITEYDTKTGKPIKETNAKREVTQDTDQVVSKEEQRAVSEVTSDSLNHFRETTQKVESVTEKVTECNGLDSFGKRMGIILGIGILFFLMYAWRKMKRWLHL